MTTEEPTPIATPTDHHDQDRSPAHDHSHAHGPAEPASPRARIAVLAALIPLAVITAVAMIVLWPGAQERDRTGLGLEQELARGTVISLADEPCDEPDPGFEGEIPLCPTATVLVTSGPGEDTEIKIPAPEGVGAPELSAGDKIVLTYEPTAPQGAQYTLSDFQRDRPLAVLALIFAAAIIAFGRFRGVAAIAGLVVSFAVLLKFVLPAILAGTSPLLVAVVGASAIMLVVLYLTHGMSIRTSVAVLGTLSSLALTGVLGTLVTAAGHFTGLAGEEAAIVGSLYEKVDVKGLLLAGIVIGALGVLDDVTVTQAATVDELSRANPDLSRREVYAAAARVGREHIASTVNTLVLAYAGASLPLLLLFSAGGHAVTDLLTTELVAQEVVRSAVGSVGIVAAVPVTTALAVLLLTGPARRGEELEEYEPVEEEP